MIKHISFRNAFSFCFLFCLLLVNKQASASHAMGADLSYECINPATNTYKVTLRFYRDCFGLRAPTTITLNYFSASCGQNLTATLSQEPCPPNTSGGTPCEVSPLCPSSIGQSTCNGGTFPGVQAYTYTAVVTLPQSCPDWTFSFDECCRNNQITNISNASSEDMYIQATLNNTLGGCNNSPVFTTLPVPYICVGQPFFYNHGAVDADGDSLVYSLVTPLGAGGASVTYAGGYSSAYPLSTTTGTFPFNINSGQMNFTPSITQVAVVTVLVQEYRNGVLIGSTMRDIQIVVVNLPGCANPAPTFSGAIQPTVQNGVYLNSSLIQVCPGQSLSFTTLAREQSGDSIFVQSNIAQAIPGAQFTTSYHTRDSVYGIFQWTPSGLDTGMNTFIVTIQNRYCPLSSNQAYAITVQVLAGTYAGPDLAYCPAGGTVQLQAYGGTSFTWSPTQGLDNPNIGNPLASPAQTTTYIVTSNLSSTCKNKDTVIVNRVPDFQYTLSASSDTICRFEFAHLTAIPDVTYAPYSYTWEPPQTLNNALVYNPVAQPDFSTTYTVTMKANTGCIIKDTLRVTVRGQGPAVKISADKYNVCEGDTIHLTSDISTFPCGLNVVPCEGNFSLKTIGTGVLTSNNLYNGLFEDNRIQMLFRSSELQAQGMTAGTITDIAFNIMQHSSSIPYNGFTIKMGCTEVTALSGFVPGLSQVMYSPSLLITGTGFSNHNLNTPYDWDGQSNLLVEICFDNNGFSLPDVVSATNTGFNSVISSFADGSSGCSLSIGTPAQNRPNIQFVYCEAPPKTVTYSWSPTHNIFPPDSLNPFVVLNERTTYFLTANDGSCNGSGSITLNIDTSFGLEAGGNASFCNGVPVQLNASVYGNLPTGGNISCGANGSSCTGTSTVNTFSPPNLFSSTITPFQGALLSPIYEDQRTQILYRASDLLAAGFRSGTINQIGINVSAKGAAFFQDLNIKLGCTPKAALSDTVWEPTTVVYSAPFLPFTSVPGWNDFILQNPYDWDGISNIVLEICWNNPTGTPSFGQDAVSAAAVNYNCFHTLTAASAVGCSLTPAGSQIYQVLPEMRAQICAAATLPVTYRWTPANGLSDTTIANPTASPSQPTTYYVTAYYGGACPKTDSLTVSPQTFEYSVSDDTVICKGDEAFPYVNGGSSYFWQPSLNLSCVNCSSPVASPDSSTIYYVQITDSTTGCIVNDSVVVTVEFVTATTSFDSIRIEAGDAVTLSVTAIGGTGSYFYNWSPADYLNNTNISSPVATPLADIVYTVTVSSGLCTDTASSIIYVDVVESPVKVPNAFSPNGDGKNDVFFPVSNGLVSVKIMRIYNRYGELVHNSPTPWDGKLKGVLQPAGTFVYYIEIEHPGMENELLQGAVTLIH